MNLESDFLPYRTNIFGVALGSIECCEVRLVCDMAWLRTGNPVYYELLYCLKFQLLSTCLGGEESFFNGDTEVINTSARDVYVALTSYFSSFSLPSWITSLRWSAQRI